jgi:hypothetical protein
VLPAVLPDGNARDNTGQHELRGRYSTNRDSRGELDFTERALVKAEDYDQAAALFQWMAGRSGARLPGPPLARGEGPCLPRGWSTSSQGADRT